MSSCISKEKGSTRFIYPCLVGKNYQLFIIIVFID